MANTAAPVGLIHAILLDGSGGGAPCDWDRVEQWHPEDGCVWLHFDFEEEEARDWLEHSSGLNDIAFQALVNPETRPRALNRGDNLLLSLRGINLNPGEDPDDLVSVRLWTDGARLISTRRRRLISTEEVLEELQSGCGPRNAVELLVSWIDRITWHMNPIIEGFEDRVLALEEQVLNENVDGVRKELAELRKQAISVRRYLAPQREAMNRLVSENLSWLDDLNRLRLREVNDRLIRYIEDIDETLERAAVSQDELLNRISEQMNKRSYIFTLVATIFLPLGFFTGLLGVNVGGIPGAQEESGFWIVVILCLAVTVGLMVFFRLKRWL